MLHVKTAIFFIGDKLQHCSVGKENERHYKAGLYLTKLTITAECSI